MEENQLVITDPQTGEERLCEILFTHHANGKRYVIFEFLDSEEVSAAIYVPEEGTDEGFLSDIETDEEWAMIEAELDKYYDEAEEFEFVEDEDDLEA